MYAPLRIYGGTPKLREMPDSRLNIANMPRWSYPVRLPGAPGCLCHSPAGGEDIGITIVTGRHMYEPLQSDGLP